MNKLFEIREICTSLRPAKAVVFIHEGDEWHDTALRVIETLSQIWGGQRNLIIPTDGKKIDEKFWFLLEKFDPDYFFIYNESPKNIYEISDELKKEILKRLNPFHETNSNDPIESFYLNPSYPLTFVPDIIPNTHIEIPVLYNPIVDTPLLECNNYLKLVIHSVLGKLTDEYSKKLNRLSLKMEEKKLGNESLGSFLSDVLWNSDGQDYYPFYYSMLKLERYRRVKDGKKIREAPIVTVIGDSLADFSFYYDLSSLRYDVFWAPESLIKSSFNEVQYIRKTKEKSESGLTLFNSILLTKLIDKVNESNSNRKIVFTSISKSKKNLENIKDILIKSDILPNGHEEIKQALVCKDMEKLLTYVLRIMEYDNYSNCYREQFVDFKSINRIKTPIPRNFSDRSFQHHFWITEINVEDYQLPQYPILINSINTPYFYTNSEIRITNRGIAYFCPSTGYVGGSIDKYLVKPYLNLLESFEIFKQIFNKYGYVIISSDKGNYEKESIEKFDSLGKIARFLKYEQHQQFLNRLTERSNPPSADEGIFLTDDYRMYLNLKSIETILGDEIKSLINDFIEKGILHRGFIFKCEKCRYTGWYDIDEVDNKFKCKRCRTIQYYNSNHFIRQNPVEPEWFYKLDESIYQGYDNNMIVPILTLNKLNHLSDSFLYVDEIEVRRKEAPEEQYKELDICCISDGKFIVGECKIGNRLEDDEIRKYKDIYDELGVDKIVFSTFNKNGWSKGTLKKIDTILGKNYNYQIFKKDDLINY